MSLPDGFDVEIIFGYLILAIVVIIIIYYLISDSIYIYKQRNFKEKKEEQFRELLQRTGIISKTGNTKTGNTKTGNTKTGNTKTSNTKRKPVLTS